MAAVIPNQPAEMVTRSTKEGRRLTYCLKVIQQPERARACGSGAKSSADRRPVDPPPVVELKIHEGEDDKGPDVTFSYNANFFLFATLELDRPMAHGRVQPSSPQVPVLTGMPVSGMAYLDRPKEAGYFIFPDLSVRHEGRYRLSFNLYEETKEPKDADAEPLTDPSKPKISSPSGAHDSSFDWRLEVKSLPFTVYSAKKFPGLAESTALSRTVAEQGCRVRIRRDVRMRRRDGKGGGEYDEHGEEEYGRSGRTETPDIHEVYRQRSLSNHSEDRQPYPESHRRMSGEYPAPPYQSYTPSPEMPHVPPPQGGYLGFGGNPAPQYQAPPPPQYVQPQPPAQPISAQQYPPPAPYQSSQYRQPPPQGNYGGYPERQTYPQYPVNAGVQREAFEPQYRRSSVPYPTSVPQGHYPAVDSNYSRNPPYPGYPSRALSPPLPGSVNLAPLKMPPIEPKYDSLASPAGPPPSAGRFAPPLPSPSYDRGQDRPAPYGQYPVPPLASSEAARNGKRSFDTVFNPSNSTQPLYNGMRPHGQNGTYEEDDEIALEQLKMQYKRADGSSYSRELPVLE